MYSPDEGQRYSFGDREEAQERVRAELANGKLSLFLRGEKLKGSFALVRTSTRQAMAAAQAQGSLRERQRRAGAQPVGALRRRRSMILRRQRRRRASTRRAWRRPDRPRRCRRSSRRCSRRSGEAARSDPAWLYEPKLDGYRVLAFVHDGKVRLHLASRARPDAVLSRDRGPDLAAQAVDTMVLDGEIVALGADGRPSFNALQNRAQLKTREGNRRGAARIAGGAACASICCTSPASTCAAPRTSIGAATSRNACCRPRTFS